MGSKVLLRVIFGRSCAYPAHLFSGQPGCCLLSLGTLEVKWLEVNIKIKYLDNYNL